jgi:hypothetical protein
MALPFDRNGCRRDEFYQSEWPPRLNSVCTVKSPVKGRGKGKGAGAFASERLFSGV